MLGKVKCHPFPEGKESLLHYPPKREDASLEEGFDIHTMSTCQLVDGDAGLESTGISRASGG